uniref:Uncharacterized protein n=1 Tax=Vibrio tapetis TaxID=52443 RepID=E3NYV7_9VIBR|nr:hypothetical protein pVT1_38 [Vibrio tapetis]
MFLMLLYFYRQPFKSFSDLAWCVGTFRESKKSGRLHQLEWVELEEIKPGRRKKTNPWRLNRGCRKGRTGKSKEE